MKDISRKRFQLLSDAPLERRQYRFLPDELKCHQDNFVKTLNEVLAKSVERKETFRLGILGERGCGKTTVIRQFIEHQKDRGFLFSPTIFSIKVSDFQPQEVHRMLDELLLTWTVWKRLLFALTASLFLFVSLDVLISDGIVFKWIDVWLGTDIPGLSSAGSLPVRYPLLVSFAAFLFFWRNSFVPRIRYRLRQHRSQSTGNWIRRFFLRPHLIILDDLDRVEPDVQAKVLMSFYRHAERLGVSTILCFDDGEFNRVNRNEKEREIFGKCVQAELRFPDWDISDLPRLVNYYFSYLTDKNLYHFKNLKFEVSLNVKVKSAFVYCLSLLGYHAPRKVLRFFNNFLILISHYDSDKQRADQNNEKKDDHRIFLEIIRLTGMQSILPQAKNFAVLSHYVENRMNLGEAPFPVETTETEKDTFEDFVLKTRHLKSSDTPTNFFVYQNWKDKVLINALESYSEGFPLPLDIASGHSPAEQEKIILENIELFALLAISRSTYLKDKESKIQLLASTRNLIIRKKKKNLIGNKSNKEKKLKRNDKEKELLADLDHFILQMIYGDFELSESGDLYLRGLSDYADELKDKDFLKTMIPFNVLSLEENLEILEMVSSREKSSEDYPFNFIDFRNEIVKREIKEFHKIDDRNSFKLSGSLFQVVPKFYLGADAGEFLFHNGTIMDLIYKMRQIPYQIKYDFRYRFPFLTLLQFPRTKDSKDCRSFFPKFFLTIVADNIHITGEENIMRDCADIFASMPRSELKKFVRLFNEFRDSLCVSTPLVQAHFLLRFLFCLHDQEKAVDPINDLDSISRSWLMRSLKTLWKGSRLASQKSYTKKFYSCVFLGFSADALETIEINEEEFWNDYHVWKSFFIHQAVNEGRASRLLVGISQVFNTIRIYDSLVEEEGDSRGSSIRGLFDLMVGVLEKYEPDVKRDFLEPVEKQLAYAEANGEYYEGLIEPLARFLEGLR